ncbi:MAG: hypothetical protein ABI690_24265 [Chloroflexota bacterium]
MSDLSLLLLVAGTALNGILAGASLDQSIKQLPARHRIGVAAYSVYAKASDLGNGILWYAFIGIGAALLTIAAAIVAFSQGISSTQALPIYIAAVLSLLHTLVTTQAAPTMFSQRQYAQDEAALVAVFNRFERWQTLRAILQVMTFGVLLWGIIAYLQ